MHASAVALGWPPLASKQVPTRAIGGLLSVHGSLGLSLGLWIDGLVDWPD